MYCKHCGKEIADGSRFCNHCGEKQDIQEPIQVESVESSTVSCDEVQQTEEDKQKANIKKSQSPKKKIGCFTIFLIVASILFANWFVRPMAKLYMRQRMNQQVEASGVYGAGLDRAEPIMDKLRKETPSTLEFLGELKKVYYGIGTITMEFKKADYENSPSGNAARNYVVAEIQAMPNSLKKVLKEIVEEDFSLSIEIHPYETTTSGYTIINLSPYELGKVINQ